MTTITTPTGSYTPVVVRAIDSDQDTGNNIHHLIGGGVDVTFQPARPRKGSLQMLFASLITADDCRRAHTAAGAFSLADTDAFRMNMTYVPQGRIRLESDDRVEGAWWVIVQFQELP